MMLVSCFKDNLLLRYLKAYPKVIPDEIILFVCTDQSIQLLKVTPIILSFL